MGDIVPLRPAPTLNTICADCGQPIEWYPPKDRWGSKVADDGVTDVWVFTCRVVRHRGIIVEADYHHPLDEPQQRYRIGRRP